jgi:hypothetical protein
VLAKRPFLVALAGEHPFRHESREPGGQHLAGDPEVLGDELPAEGFDLAYYVDTFEIKRCSAKVVRPSACSGARFPPSR